MSFASCEASQEGARGQAPFRHPFVADFPARFDTSDFPLRISMRAFCRRCPRRTSSGGARYNCSMNAHVDGVRCLFRLTDVAQNPKGVSLRQERPP